MTRITRLAMFLEAHFGEIELHLPESPFSVDDAKMENSDEIPGILISQDDAEAFVNLTDMASRPALSQKNETKLIPELTGG